MREELTLHESAYRFADGFGLGRLGIEPFDDIGIARVERERERACFLASVFERGFALGICLCHLLGLSPCPVSPRAEGEQLDAVNGERFEFDSFIVPAFEPDIAVLVVFEMGVFLALVVRVEGGLNAGAIKHLLVGERWEADMLRPNAYSVHGVSEIAAVSVTRPLDRFGAHEPVFVVRHRRFPPVVFAYMVSIAHVLYVRSEKLKKIYVLKIRGGCDTYVKRDGTQGTAGKGALVGEDIAFTVAATQDQTLIAPIKNDQTPKLGNVNDPAFTLRHGGQGGTIDYIADVSNYVVRRLMPLECERLQGFPDNYTLIPYNGKPAEQCPDGPRYKALGNSMAVPVMRWIGERLLMVEEILEEKGAT